jgi:hypothetical protein
MVLHTNSQCEILEKELELRNEHSRFFLLPNRHGRIFPFQEVFQYQNRLESTFFAP